MCTGFIGKVASRSNTRFRLKVEDVVEVMGNKGIKLIKPIKINLEEYAELEWNLEHFNKKKVLTPESQTLEPSFPSQNKMDEQGVHSPTNAKRSTVSDNKDTASAVQTVAGKDTSNPFMTVILPKNKDEGSLSRQRLPRSFTQIETITKKTMLHKKKKNDKIEKIIKKTLEKFFQQQDQDKHVIPIPNPDPNGERLVPDTEHSSGNNNVTSSGEEDYGEHAYYQDAQDPNEDDDSGMSFDFIALHNLDT
ncbi:hypothetical protein H5410_049799 [Solanum commersonii]|uniref:Uncharacterized protein n=1 Tax=Solanum commersonii TaxID=4109 RepID=A0A9J5WVQ5_SOLCO|nr:hypothetical protein H5410_049799 [Solanum commersonii]